MMVYGINSAVCSKCGRGYVTGDCIELDGVCGTCKRESEKSKCSECGNEYYTGDRFVFDGKCDLCFKKEKNPCKEVDLTHLVSPCMKEALKKEISKLLTSVLSGTDERYRYIADDMISYIRWGLVEKEISSLIDLYWGNEND